MRIRSQHIPTNYGSHKAANRRNLEHSLRMDDCCNSENENDLSDPNNERDQITKVDCVIIGAGAAGLKCAAKLLDNEKQLSVVVLEARDRVGGRILTTDEKAILVGTSDSDEEEVSFRRDHGAAWVHGAHETNPMMELLSEIKPECNSTTQELDWTTSQQSLPETRPVFGGNAWVRPHTVLHGNVNSGRTKSLISYFVNGSIVPDELESEDENDTGNDNVPEDKNNQDIGSLRSSQSSPISRAIRRHYRLLHEMIVEFDDDDYENHESVATLYEELTRRRVHYPNIAIDNEETIDEERLVNLLTPFYLYLMENWNGISMNETGVEQIVELLVPEQNDDDDSECDNLEEKKEDQTNIIMSETDEQYVSAGDFMGPHCKIKTGMFTVLQPLIRRIHNHQQNVDHKIIRLQEEVVSIINKTNHVLIETASGKAIEARCCVNTMPLGCLQHSLATTKPPVSSSNTSRKSFFQPRLSDQKIEGINSIWSGSYKKVFLTFDHIFWPKDTPMIGLIRSAPEQDDDDSESSSLSSSRLPGRHLVVYNLWAKDNIPSIEVILCGNLGKWAFQKEDETIQRAVIEFMESSMGLRNLSDACTGCHVTRWEEDEFTRGSYSTFHLGTHERHVDALRSSEWDGRLIFAGEATESDHMGSVHAGLMSGDRAAREVLEFTNSA